MNKKVKKQEESVTLPVRCPESLKNAFIEACQGQDSTASREIRDFMRKYVAKHGQQRLI